MKDRNEREALKARFDELDTEALQRIVHSADYTDIGIAVARQLLAARGVAELTVQVWRDPKVAEGVSRGLCARNATELHASARRRKTVHLVTLWSCVTVLGVAFLTGLAPERTAQLDGALEGVWLVAVLSFLFGGVLMWRRPPVFLVLRPFDHRSAASALRKFIKRYFRYHGHVYTLADSMLSGDPSVFPWRDTILWGLPGLLVSFPRRVQHEEDVWAIRAAMGRRIPRALNWLFSIDKIFKIRASSEWWKRSVQALATSSELILLDLSRIGPGIAWEVAELHHYGLTRRTIVVTHRANATDALRFVADNWPRELKPFVAVYDDDGVVEQPNVLVQHIEEALLVPSHRAG